MKILVIDNDTRLLDEARQILVRNGHFADCVNNADDAVTTVRENYYDFVLVERRMPGHDGLWFLKNASIPRYTKILLITSRVSAPVIVRMFKAGISGYVMKPLDENELLQHLQFHSNRQVIGHPRV